MGDQKFKRRNYIINRRFQFGFLFTALPLLILLAAAIGVSVPMLSQPGAGKWIFISLIMIFILLLIIFSVAFTHSIAGPIYKLGNTIRGISEGKVPRRAFTFRETDQFQWLAEDFDKYLDTLRKFQSDKEEVLSNLEYLKKSLKTGNLTGEQGAQAVEKIIRRINEKSPS